MRLRLLSLMLSYMDVKFEDLISLNNVEEWERKFKNKFITYNLKINGNTPYPIILKEESLSPIERIAMIRYLMYKNKINNMDGNRLPKITSNSSQNQHWLKQGWHKDVKYWLNHWGIQEEVIMHNIDNITNTITSKENMWCDKELKDKRKLRYYKEVANPNLVDQKYLSIAKKKINIAKIRTNSHKLHSENGLWTIPKTLWDERIYHL